MILNNTKRDLIAAIQAQHCTPNPMSKEQSINYKKVLLEGKEGRRKKTGKQACIKYE